MNTASAIRHLLTYLAGIGGVLLSGHLIAADQVDAVNKAASELMAPAAVILGAVAATLVRLLIGWVQTLFRHGAGERGNGSGALMLLVWIGAAAGLCMGLPSCSSGQLEAARSIPISGTLVTDYGTAGYSSKGGLSVVIDRRSGK